MRSLRLAAALLLVTFAIGCGGNSTPQVDPTRNLSVAGHQAYQATRVVKALDIVRDVAVAAQQNKLLSEGATRKIVIYHESSVKIIAAMPTGGWKGVVDQGITEIQKDLTLNEWNQIAPYVALLKTVLGEVQQ